MLVSFVVSYYYNLLYDQMQGLVQNYRNYLILYNKLH